MGIELPAELIELIFTMIDPEDKATCAAVCSTNKLGRRAGTPLLYQTVGMMADNMSLHDRIARTRLLCRTLATNRKLAELPSAVKYRLHETSIQQISFIPDLQQDYELWRDALGREGCFVHGEVFATLERCMQGKMKDGEGVFLLLMIALCRAPRKLELVGDLHVMRYMRFVRWALTDIHLRRVAPCAAQCGIYQIRDVRLEHDSVGRDMVAVDIGFWLRLPALETLVANQLSESRLYAEGADGWEKPHAVRALKIERFFGKVDDLEFLIPCCRNLQALDVTFGVPVAAHRQLSWYDLGRALVEHCPALQHLRIDHGPDSMTDDEDLDEIGHDDDVDPTQDLHGLSCLAQMTNLKSLVVTKGALLGVSAEEPFESEEDEDEIEDNDAQDDADDEGDEGDDDIGDRHEYVRSHVDLASILPGSLEELTIICEDEYISRDERALLHDPYVLQLRNMTVMNCQQTHWFSKVGGEGGEDPRKRARGELPLHLG